MASAPRSTEIIKSDGHATTQKDENKGTMIPIVESGLITGLEECSLEDTLQIEDESAIHDCATLLCITELSSDGLVSTGIEAEEDKGSQGLFDLVDSSLADDQNPDQINKNDGKQLLLKTTGEKYVHSACRPCGGSSPDVALTSGQRMCCKPLEAMHSVPVTYRSDQFEGWNTESGDHPENCRQLYFCAYYSPLRSRSYRSDGSTQKITSAKFERFNAMRTFVWRFALNACLNFCFDSIDIDPCSVIFHFS